MVNKEVDQFIRACAHCQLVNLCSHEAQQLLQTIEPDTPFDVVFIDFWEPGDIPYQDGYRNILACLDCMTVFGISTANRMKEIKSYQAARWYFWKFFVLFGLPKIIVVGVYRLFSGMFKKNYHETFLIPVHAVARRNQKSIRNEWLHRYLKMLQKINSEYKGSLRQWLQGVLFVLYAWNSGPVDGTDIAWSVVAIRRELPFHIDLSSASLREVTSEGKQALDNF